MKKLFGIMVLFVFFIAAGWTAANRNVPLEDSVFRLHVIANSDDPADQVLKMAVKDDILLLMQQEFSGVGNADEARQLAQADIPLIQSVASNRIIANGYNYPVSVYVGEYEFPTKSYGNLVFPPGNYQALRVVIGEGQGKNWWCVLFPPLCLVSSDQQALGLNTPQQAQITFKCLELIPRGVKVVNK